MFVLSLPPLDVPSFTSLSSNHWANCWCISSLWSETCLPLKCDNFFPSSFSHLVPPSTNMFPQRGRRCITLLFFSFFSLLTFFILRSFSYNVRSHRLRTFPLSPLVSLLCLLSPFLPSSLVFKSLAFLSSPSAFLSSFSPWTDPSPSMWALFICPQLWQPPWASRPHQIPTQVLPSCFRGLRWGLGMPLWLVCVSFEGESLALWEQKCVFLRPQMCSTCGLRSWYCMCLLLLKKCERKVNLGVVCHWGVVEFVWFYHHCVENTTKDRNCDGCTD